MRFWDSSAVVPLLCEEAQTPLALELSHGDPEMMVWALAPLECLSALRRKERQQEISLSLIEKFQDRLGKLQSGWTEIENILLVRRRAERLIAIHALSAADSLQLAAALVGTRDRPHLLEFVCFDHLLAQAAQREGFRVRS